MPESIQKLSRWRGKNLERTIADKVHGVVCGRSKAVKVERKWIQINPQQPPDVINEWASFECKSRKSVPKLIKDGMTQSIRNAPEGLIPYLILYDRGDRNYYVVQMLHDFLDLHIGDKGQQGKKG